MAQEVGEMALFFEILTSALAAFGLICLGWLIYGRLVLPVGERDGSVCILVDAQGEGESLEQTVSALLWLRKTGLWRGAVVIRDGGLTPAGLVLARKLAQRPGVELHTGPDKGCGTV